MDTSFKGTRTHELCGLCVWISSLSVDQCFIPPSLSGRASGDPRASIHPSPFGLFLHCSRCEQCRRSIYVQGFVCTLLSSSVGRVRRTEWNCWIIWSVYMSVFEELPASPSSCTSLPPPSSVGGWPHGGFDLHFPDASKDVGSW